MTGMHIGLAIYLPKLKNCLGAWMQWKIDGWNGLHWVQLT